MCHLGLVAGAAEALDEGRLRGGIGYPLGTPGLHIAVIIMKLMMIMIMIIVIVIMIIRAPNKQYKHNKREHAKNKTTK